MSGSDPFFVEGEWKCTAETAKAILVESPGKKDRWIPISQVHDDSEVFERGGSGKLAVRKWFAVKEGWTDDDDDD